MACPDTPKSSSLWIEIERYKKPKTPKKKVVSSPEEVAILFLNHFAKTPRISFGTVKITTSKEEILRIRNPEEYCQLVTVERVPEKKGFVADTSHFEIEPNAEKCLVIKWTPTEVGSYRELITFRVEGLFHKQVILLGRATAPFKKVLKTQNGSTSTSDISAKKPIVVKKRVKSKSLRIKRLERNTENKNISDKSSTTTNLSKKASITKPSNVTHTLLQVEDKSNHLNDSLDANGRLTPEISRAFRNQSKCVSQQKSAISLRLAPDLRHSDSQLQNNISDISSSTDPSQPILSKSSTTTCRDTTFKMVTVLPPCEVPLTPERRQTYVSQSATCLDSNVRFEATEEVPITKLIDSSDRRQTYISRSATYLDNNVKFEAAEGVAIANLINSPDRRQTYSVRNVVSLGEVTSPTKKTSNRFPPCDIPDTPERRQTYTKEWLSTHITVPTISSPEILQTIHFGDVHQMKMNLGNRKTKIPEPLFRSPLRRSQDRKKRVSEINELEDSLEKTSSSFSADELDVEKGVCTNAPTLNESADYLIKLPATDVSDCQLGSGEFYNKDEKTLQITDLDYNKFCKVLSANTDVPEWGLTRIDQIVDNDKESDLFCANRCSTEIKIPAKRDSQVIEDSCIQLFTDLSPPKTETITSKTFVKKSPPLEQSLQNTSPETNIKENVCPVSKAPVSPSLKRPQNDKNEIQKVKTNKQRQNKGKRNTSKTSSDSRSSKDDRSGSSSQNSHTSTKKRTYKSNTFKKNESATIGLQTKLKLIKPPETNKGTTTPRHPNPFAAKNIYYDEQWIEKQTQGFKRWLNFILTLPDEFSVDEQQVAIGKSLTELNRDASYKQAPSREMLSLRTYSARKKMNVLRRQACSLYESEPFVKVITRLEYEIENRRIVVRSDKALHADIGIKQKLIDVILNYNPLWLRIGLETVFGQILPLQSNDDVEGLSQFILKNMLNNPNIAKEYAHPTVPHLYKSGYPTALKKHTLKKFLLLVYFLDQAKENHLINYNPCLFRSDAKIKSSRDLLLTFSRDHLSGEGDVTKHLAFFGYKVTHFQTVLDEYDFSVTNLATDLRNGLRIARAAQLLTKNWNLMNKLRVPAVSRIQKIHNVTTVLNALSEYGAPIADVTAKHIVNGHCEKTLSLLWQLILKFQLNIVINEEKLQREINYLKRNLRDCKLSDLFVSTSKLYEEEKIKMLLHWCQLVCAHYKLRVENFTVSFSDARAICYIIHHYHPSLLPIEQIRTETTQTVNFQQNNHCGDSSLSSEDSFSANWLALEISPKKYEELLENEQENFKLALQKIAAFGGIPMMIKPSYMSNTIPDEKVTMVFISHLCARFLDLSEELRAVKTIQNAWRELSTSKTNESFKIENQAAIVIQRSFRKYILKIRLEKTEKQKEAAIQLQRWYRSRLSRRKFMLVRKGIIRLQAIIRSFLILRQLKKLSLPKLTKSAVVIQKWTRMYLVRKRYLKLRRATICIQRIFKAKLLQLKNSKIENEAACRIQNYFRKVLAIKQTERKICFCVKLQARSRGFLVRKGIEEVKREIIITERNKAATCIQSVWKMYSERKEYLKKMDAIITIQTYFAAYLFRRWFLVQRECAIKIQRWYKSSLETKRIRENYLEEKKSAITIQRYVRGWIQRKRLWQMKTAAIAIQCYYRRQKMMKRIEKKKWAVITLQRWIKSCWKAKEERFYFLDLKAACLIFQKNWRRHVNERNFQNKKAAAIAIQKNIRRIQCQRKYFKMKNSAIIFQKQWRSILCRRQFQKLKKNAILIQSLYRGFVQQRYYQMIKSNTIEIQLWFRGCLQMRIDRDEFLNKRQAAICIQSWVRRWIQFKKYNQTRKAVLAIQSHHRRFQVIQMTYIRIWAISVIQLYAKAYVKGVRERRNFIRVKSAVVTLQCHFRGWKCRMDLKSQIYSSIIIQKYWRGKRERRRFILMKRAVFVISEWFLSWRFTKCLRLEFLICRKAAILIQTAWRGYKVRKMMKLEIKAAAVIQTWFRRSLYTRQCRQSFLKLRNAVIRIQAIYRGCRVRNNLFYQNEAAAVIQSAYRAWAQKRQFERIKWSVPLIQQFWRGWQLTRTVRNQYLDIKCACICIQANVKCWIVRRRFIQMKEAAIVIQQQWRIYNSCKREYLKYHIQRGAAIVIQSRYRGYRVRKIMKSMLKQELRHVLSNMKYYGGIMKLRRWKDFHIIRGAAITIQSWIRGWIVRRQVQRVKEEEKRITTQLEKIYSDVVPATIGLQAVVRGYLTRKRLYDQRCVCGKFGCNNYVNVKMRNYNSLVKAVGIFEKYYQIVIMRNMTSSELSQACYSESTKRLFNERQRFVISREAAITIQRFWRAYVEATNVRNQYLCLRSAAVTIQACFRGYRCRKQLVAKSKRLQRREFDAVKELDIIEEKIISRRNYLLCFASAAKLHLKAIFLQRKFRQYHNEKISKAATIIQATWRGYFLRNQIADRRVSDVRSRILEVTQSAVMENTLWHRTTRALDYLFHCRNLSTVWLALSNLNTSSRLSPVCCEHLSESGGVAILYQLIHGCNRSLPHMDVIVECLSILLNVAKHEPTRYYVWKVKDSILFIVNLLRIYYEKNEKIVLKCCSLIWTVALDEACVKEIKRDEMLKKRIVNLCAIVSRRSKSVKNFNSDGSFNRRKVLPSLRFQPEWNLGTDHEREFTHLLQAMTLVINLFNSWV